MILDMDAIFSSDDLSSIMEKTEETKMKETVEEIS